MSKRWHDDYDLYFCLSQLELEDQHKTLGRCWIQVEHFLKDYTLEHFLSLYKHKMDYLSVQ